MTSDELKMQEERRRHSLAQVFLHQMMEEARNHAINPDTFFHQMWVDLIYELVWGVGWTLEELQEDLRWHVKNAEKEVAE